MIRHSALLLEYVELEGIDADGGWRVSDEVGISGVWRLYHGISTVTTKSGHR